MLKQLAFSILFILTSVFVKTETLAFAQVKITHPNNINLPPEVEKGITTGAKQVFLKKKYEIVNLLDFTGADPTGATDSTLALIRAVSDADHVIIPPGQYTLNGVSTVDLSNVSLECKGAPASANASGASLGKQGATFWLTSTTVQPFTVSNSVRIVGCNFYWPNQNSSTENPVVYPPLFTEAPGKQLTNFDLVNDRIINAYDVLVQSNIHNAFGGIILSDTYGYAIHYWLSLANVPETLIIKGMIADWALFQAVANSGKKYLINWTAANGAFLHIFGNGNGTSRTSTVSVSGIVFDGTVFAYNKFIWVDKTGSLNESIFHGISDAVPHALQVDAGGCINQISMDMLYYGYQWLGGGFDNDSLFSIINPARDCTVNSIDLRGVLAQTQANVLDIKGKNIKSVSLRLGGNGVYAQTKTKGTYYFADISGPDIVFNASGNYIQPKTAQSGNRGFYIQSCYECNISGNTFNGVYNPIAIETSNIPVTGVGNLSLASPSGSSAVVGTGKYAHQLLNSNSWDLLSRPMVSSCGVSPSIDDKSTDSSGAIAVGSGIVTTCTLNFANAFASLPKCTFVGTVSSVFLSGISTTSITINSGGINMGASQIYYQCQP